MFRLYCYTVVVGIVFGCQSPLQADEKFPSYLSSEEAGPDFLVQGEYVGKVGGLLDIGAQVIAMGEDRFEGVLYRGGLPGAGWDGDVRFHFKGQRNGDTASFVGIMGERLKFENQNFHGTIRDGIFHGKSIMFRNVVDHAFFEMTKVQRRSPTLGAKPPPGAIVLFDGTHTDEWIDAQIVEQNLLNVGTESRREFKNLMFHLEFRTPFMPTARGMQRGNSGVYVKKEWEIQIVDSFGWNTENRKFERLANFGRCGGIHELVKPRVNMCFPPLSWQTYDVEFISSRFDEQGNRVSPGMITVKHNDVVIHDKYVLAISPSGEGPGKEKLAGPLYLQQHRNPVRFRNIWVVELD